MTIICRTEEIFSNAGRGKNWQLSWFIIKTDNDFVNGVITCADPKQNGEVEVYFYFITGGGGGFEAYIPKFNYEPSEI